MESKYYTEAGMYNTGVCRITGAGNLVLPYNSQSFIAAVINKIAEITGIVSLIQPDSDSLSGQRLPAVQ